MSTQYKRLIRFTVLIAIIVYIVSHKLISKAHTNNIKILQQILDEKHYDINAELNVTKPTIYKPATDTGYERVNGAFVSLAKNDDLMNMADTVRNYEDRFNSKYHYDWIFINDEEFSGFFKKQMSNIVSGKATFVTIPKEMWQYPDWVDGKKALYNRIRSRINMPYGASDSYRFMCRFYSGFFHHLEALQGYDYAWRVEPETRLLCDVKFDVFKYMKDNDKKYGFTMAIHEYEQTIPTLWKSVKEFIRMYPQYLSPNNLLNFISDNQGETYNLCHFWTNFEVVDLRFLRTEAYETFFDFLDKKGGFFYERWGDAPIHSIAVSLFLQKDKVHFFEEIGYFHKPNSHCPIDPDIWTENNCLCDRNIDVTFRDYSCVRKYYDVQGLQKPVDWELHTGNGQYFD